MTLPARDAAGQVKLEAALVDLFGQRISFNHLLGLNVDSLQPVPPACAPGDAAGVRQRRRLAG